ncbi:MAG: NAD-dependent epimerase/dehydratase family protein [Actinomycetota bacterium]|nr:NAD-dependent epimerase/dehydratase family protein [Actinomycetota bacterium]
MRILVTGGAGFIGSHVVDELMGLDHEVVVLDSLDRAAHAEKPRYLDPRAAYVWGDVRDPEAVREAVEGADAVCHQAARVGLGVDFDDVTRYVADNDEGTAVLLRALHRDGFTGRFVLASSMVVYGEGRYRCPTHGSVRPGPRRPSELEAGRFEPPCPACGRALRPEPVPEDTILDPRNVYAATKLHQEHLCSAFGREHDVAVTALRYHNVYGPRMPRDTPYAGVASIFRSALAAGRPPQVYEDGAQRRDFVHVSDVAHANVLALTGAEPRPGPFNVCSGEPHTVGELATTLAAAMGGQAPVTTGAHRLGDVRHVFASPDRAREVLGFDATVSFAEGVAAFVTAELRAPVPG